MSFLALLAALLLAHYRQPKPWMKPARWHIAMSQRLNHWLNDGRLRHGVIAWFLAVLLPVIAIAALYWESLHISPILGWVVSLGILYITINFNDFTVTTEAIAASLRDGNLNQAKLQLASWVTDPVELYDAATLSRITIETTLLRAHSAAFAPIFWFVLLGPAGAALYRLAELTHLTWGKNDNGFNKASMQVFYWLNWLPAHASAISFAVAGNFEDAMYCWRTQAESWQDRLQGIMLASGAGALGVRIGEPRQQAEGLEYRPDLGLGDTADADYLMSTVGLVWRVLVLIMVLVLLLTFANWLGS